MALNGGAAQSETEAMAELVEQMWQRYIRPKVMDELMTHSLSGYKATVEQNNGDNTLKVSRPFDCTSMNLKCSSALTDTVQEGDQVLVVTLGDMSNAFVLCKTDMSGMGEEEPYAEVGTVAEITVDELSTSRRVKKYILQDTSDDNYVHIKNDFIKFMSGTVSSQTPVQTLNRYSQPLYWQRQPVSHTADGYPLDANGRQIYTTTRETDWPVYQYTYEELIKGQQNLVQQNGVYEMELVLGAGDENGRSKGIIYKGQNELMIRYLTSSGAYTDITLSNYLDLTHLRKPTSLDFSDWDEGYFSETVDGRTAETWQITFDADGNPVKFTDAEGHETAVIW